MKAHTPIHVFSMLFLVLALTRPQTFTFQSQGKTMEGVLALPAGRPKALILYFHRAIEDRNAVATWGELLTKDGYAIAGYTADQSLDAKQEANDSLNGLLAQKRFASMPVISMGASMGAIAAAELFATNKRVMALILIVPASFSVCDALNKAGGRSVFLIQAENDDVAGSTAQAIRKCLPESGRSFLLRGASHRFPPSDVSPQILQWLSLLN